MYFMFLEITNPEYKEDVFLALQSIGIERASTIETSNISGELSDELTFFTGFFRSDKIEQHRQLLVISQVRTKEQAKELLENLREGGADIDNQDIVSLTLIPAAITFDSEHGYYEEQE
jgi:hypothetical protein